MSVGEVFSKAFELWKKDVLWLILAGLVMGVIIWVVALAAGLIIGALAVGGVALGVSSGTDSFSGLGAAALFGSAVVGIIAVFLIAVLGTTLQGGLYEMVIGAAKHDRPVQFGDLFSGFRRFGSYVVFALVLTGIGIGFLLLFVTLIGIPVAIALAIWLGVIWLYVLPLITDQDLTFGEAQRRSREMVKESASGGPSARSSCSSWSSPSSTGSSTPSSAAVDRCVAAPSTSPTSRSSSSSAWSGAPSGCATSRSCIWARAVRSSRPWRAPTGQSRRRPPPAPTRPRPPRRPRRSRRSRPSRR